MLICFLLLHIKFKFILFCNLFKIWWSTLCKLLNMYILREKNYYCLYIYEKMKKISRKKKKKKGIRAKKNN